VKTLDRRSDVWSLGVVLCECLTGRRLFKSESELEILRMIIEDTPAAVRSLRPEVPAAIDSLLSAVFAKHRDDRLGSCAEFADYVWAVFREEGYQTDQQALAAFFRKSLPERCASLDRLLAGEDWHLEPTCASPSSGSFRGTDFQSGIAPVQSRAAPVTGGFNALHSSQVSLSAPMLAPAVTQAVPAQPAAGRTYHVITIAAVGLALMSLGGVAALAMKLRAQQPTQASSQSQPSQQTQPSSTPRVEPAANTTPSNAAQAQPQPVNTTTVPSASQRTPISPHLHHTPAERRTAPRGNLVGSTPVLAPAPISSPSSHSHRSTNQTGTSESGSATSTRATPTANARPVEQSNNSSPSGSSGRPHNDSSNDTARPRSTMSTIREW